MLVHIVDIDGTIADNTHRQSMLKKDCVRCACSMPPKHQSPCPNCGCNEGKIPQECWDTFMDDALLALDEPVVEAQRVIKYFKGRGDIVLFLTGRGERHRAVTEQWLIKYFTFGELTPVSLYMRGRLHDGITASDYKEMALIKVIKDLPTDSQLMFYEDDPFVFRMYSQYGTVFQGPECWASMVPKGVNRSTEPRWNV